MDRRVRVIRNLKTSIDTLIKDRKGSGTMPITPNPDILTCARWSLEKQLEIIHLHNASTPIPTHLLLSVKNNLKTIIELAGGERYDTPTKERTPARS